MEKTFILDSTAFYAGIPYRGPLRCYTTQLVIDEVSHGEVAREVIRSLVESGRVVVMKPSRQSVEEAKEAAGKTGDGGRISRTDLSVVALGLELKGQGYDVTVMSDDYSVENLAAVLNMHVAPVMSMGISKAVHWLIYCRGCGKVFHDMNMVECDVCGTKLTRKFRKTTTVSKAYFKS